jgi:hypothetical protein
MNQRYGVRNGRSLEVTRDSLKQNIMNLKNSYVALDRSPNYKNGSSSSSVWNYSSTGSQNGASVPYWDMLSLDDAREHGKEMAKQREAKLRAQRQLKSCLEGQMREYGIKKHIIKMDKSNDKHELIVDRMKKLEEEHQVKVRKYWHWVVIFDL